MNFFFHWYKKTFRFHNIIICLLSNVQERKISNMKIASNRKEFISDKDWWSCMSFFANNTFLFNPLSRMNQIPSITIDTNTCRQNFEADFLGEEKEGEKQRVERRERKNMWGRNREWKHFLNESSFRGIGTERWWVLISTWYLEFKNPNPNVT